MNNITGITKDNLIDCSKMTRRFMEHSDSGFVFIVLLKHFNFDALVVLKSSNRKRVKVWHM